MKHPTSCRVSVYRVDDGAFVARSRSISPVSAPKDVFRGGADGNTIKEAATKAAAVTLGVSPRRVVLVSVEHMQFIASVRPHWIARIIYSTIRFLLK